MTKTSRSKHQLRPVDWALAAPAAAMIAAGAAGLLLVVCALGAM